MWKKWNKTGKIKAIVLGFFALPNLFTPIGAQIHSIPIVVKILVPLIFGSFSIPVIAKFNSMISGKEITRPDWNDNPLIRKRPLSYFQFAAIFFLIIGLSMLIGTGIKLQTFNQFGLVSISFGVGILIGIWLTLKWTKTGS